MSWIEKLYQTYENNTGAIGDRNDKIPLLPICHTTQKAHITITIDADGNFLGASVVPKTDSRTIIPATEESAGRSGKKPACFPLCDKLQYLAGDFIEFGGEVTSGFANKPEEPYENYKKLLSGWCTSGYSHQKVCAVLRYIERKQVISDLVKATVLYTDETKKMINEWPDKEAPDIFKLLSGGYDNKGNPKPWQADAFIRWSVEIPGDPLSEVWLDKELWKSWENYYGSREARRGICFVTGIESDLSEQHPAKIRNDGDKAKLISSNDSSGFTFRGRFSTADEACGVGFQVTQKAHSALRWLIARQGSRDGDLAVVAWAVSGVAVPNPLLDSYSFSFGNDEEKKIQESVYTAEEVGNALAKKIAGYRSKLGSTKDVVVMALDSATPGRMAISYYRELTGSEFLARIETWHRECIWRLNFGLDPGDKRPRKERKSRIFIGAPAPRDVAETAYGRRIDDKLRKATIKRLLPCIIDGAPLPRDLVESCVRRASNRNGIGHWEWEKALGIACALFKYCHKERSYQMSLERERKTRDYLYGRLLALAENLESLALYLGGEPRSTSAEKLMQRFADRPFTTWRIIETGLTPYKVRLSAKRPGFLYNIQREIDEVINSFAIDDFTSDKSLSGEFLLGYHCQRSALHTSKGQVEGQEETVADDDNEE
ncbi:type I-C CRISPR-associated protein Cas8c/Csd1 [bacterium]|nr:MAG: type I-C CRISPR-associated protein Cas8c/Csd1 [bacterium]